MARHSLRIVMVLGMLITLIGGTGIFATFSDRATTADNTVTSGSRPKAADLRIEKAAPDPTTGQIDCNADQGAVAFDEDDLSTGLYSATNVQPGTDIGSTYICLKNVGAAPLTLTASVIDLSDLDVDCTGDEAASGDTTCGLDATQLPRAGELGPLLEVEFNETGCPTGSFLAPYTPATPLTDTTGVTWTPQPLAPDNVACVRIDVRYPTPSTIDAQLAQSDKVLWRFAFDGVAN